MGKLSGYAAAALLVLAPGAEAGHQFRIHTSAGWTNCSFIPRNFYGPMVFIDDGVPYRGTYFEGHFYSGRFSINLGYHERPVPFGWAFPVYPYRERIVPVPVPVPVPLPYEREPEHEGMPARRSPAGASVEDGEAELFRLLDNSGADFGWKKYVKGAGDRHYQVDAIVGGDVIDVVHTGDEAAERSENIPGYVYHGIPANDFDNPDQIKGAVRQKAREVLGERQ